LKIAFFIHTPGQAHLWHNVIHMLLKKNNDVIILARDHGCTCELLSKYNLMYTTYGKASSTKFGKILQLPYQLIKCFDFIKRFEPDILIGGGLIEGYISAILHKPLIAFWDADLGSGLYLQHLKSLMTVIVTPSCFRIDLGNKQVRIQGYKELAYLHPNIFKPDPSIYTELGISSHEQFTILRFGSFEAVHDVNRTGFSASDKWRLVEELNKHTRVFISAEGNLPADLKKYKLPTAHHRIHHVLYFANLLIGDTGTMAWEAAVLGTPAVICASFTPYFGNFIELEQEYGLLYCFQQADKALVKALELIRQPDLKEHWAVKRERLLNDKIDVAQFFTSFLENYPKRHGQNRAA